MEKTPAFMLKIEKKIQSELNRFEGFLYDHRSEVGGWLAKRGYYKGPLTYEMLDREWFPLEKGEHIGGKDFNRL